MPSVISERIDAEIVEVDRLGVAVTSKGRRWLVDCAGPAGAEGARNVAYLRASSSSEGSSASRYPSVKNCLQRIVDLMGDRRCHAALVATAAFDGRLSAAGGMSRAIGRDADDAPGRIADRRDGERDVKDLPPCAVCEDQGEAIASRRVRRAAESTGAAQQVRRS